MIARDFMISDIAYVTLDADLAYVARLIVERGVGAVPVVDERLAPIGIVTRSNLANGNDARATADLGEPPAFLLRNRPVGFRTNGRILRDVMTSPAIFVPDIAQIVDVARVMETHGIDHVPVVQVERIVGLVNRADLVHAINGRKAAFRRKTPVVTTAAEFRELAASHERLEKLQRAENRRQALEQREQRIQQLAACRLTDARWRELMDQARSDAVSGTKEFMLIRFPAQLCTDGGRAINAPDPNWPQTLRGEPADIFRRWRDELQPRGFQLAAQIIEFLDGVPGDAALFLMWSR